jgi:hypothetical protein
MAETEGEMSLDALLAEQQRPMVIGTIEPVPAEPAVVKITPWVEGRGCLCQFSFKVPKDAVQSVRPTGQVHHCCGKTLRVVEVKFKEDASITVGELFAQVMNSVMGAEGEEESAPFAAGGRVAREPAAYSAYGDYGFVPAAAGATLADVGPGGMATPPPGAARVGMAPMGMVPAGAAMPLAVRLPCIYGNWCGPGCGSGPTRNDLDACCKAHDECYGRYGYFNCACDRQLLNCVRPKRNILTAKGRWAIVVYNYFCAQYRANCNPLYGC